MFNLLLTHGLQYAGYGVELSLVVVLVHRDWWKKYPAFSLYATAYALIDAIVRPAVLYTYGWTSIQFSRCYWVTDIILTLGAFVLVCVFFRGACAGKKNLWPILRTMLLSVFITVTFISCFTMSRHYGHLASAFVVELSQNVYFACLVLVTLLYIMLQYIDCPDEGLNLLVCGLGIEFAGSAGGMAVAYLMRSWQGNVAFASVAAQLCSLGMLLIWFYAVTRRPENVPARELLTNYRPVHPFVEAPAHGTH